MDRDPTDLISDVDRWHARGGHPRLGLIGPVTDLAMSERTVIVMGNIGRRRRRVEVIPESEPLAPAPQQEPAPSREPAPRTPVPSK